MNNLLIFTDFVFIIPRMILFIIIGNNSNILSGFKPYLLDL